MTMKILSSVVVIALMATPAVAQPKVMAPPAPAVPQPQVVAPPEPTISTYCATIQPGNPFSPVYDYQAYSGFRATGGWDSRGSDACARDPLYAPPGTSPIKVNPYPKPNWY